MGVMEAAGVAVFLAVSSYAAFSDITRYQIPNWVSLVILADFIVVAGLGAIVGTLEPLEIAVHLGVGAAMLLAGFAMFAAGLFGGGDAKLMAAAAVWFGWSGFYRFIILVALLGGLLALILLAMRRFVPSAWMGRKWLAALASGDHGMPYGIAIAVAVWLMFCPLIAPLGP